VKNNIIAFLVIRYNPLKKHKKKNVNSEVKKHPGVYPEKTKLFNMHKFLPVEQLYKIDY
jgi:hypothetical protein